MSLPQPPKRDDPRIDDWLFKLWREQTGSPTGAARAFPGANRATSNGNTSISAGYTAYIPHQFEIASGDSVILEAGSVLEIG